ncbi:alpha/beta hydrolase domain-containing protein [Nonomuraea sp. JJY05]|uniref:alpha/beta hydrolase domain-containing protein n=1 Tax=Nonomuraea sp. JJY05 TaxID=3350255 RepID=UPI00373F3B86
MGAGEPAATLRPQVGDRRTATSPATLTRDANQIARGGIRLAAVDAPTERNTGWNIGLTDATSSACRQGGTWIPFDETTVNVLYPSHRDYVTKVRQATERNLRDGFITRRDADRTVRDAERSGVGR